MRLRVHQCSFAARYFAAQPLRTAYLIFTLILAFASYFLLVALGSPFSPAKSANSQHAGFIYVRALYGALPEHYAREIASINGVKRVRYGNYTPVQCRAGVTATLNGVASVGGPAIPSVAHSLSPGKLQAWYKEHNGMLVGDALARRCHWQVGTLLTFQGGTGAQSAIKVRIVAIYHVGAKNPVLNQVALVHYDYLDELNAASERGRVSSLSVYAANPNQAAELAVAIDTYFADHSPPTESSTATASQDALAQFGDVLKIVEFVMAAVFACALLVTVNVAAHTVAERRAQFAVLRVLGFSRWWLFWLVTVELLYVAALGCGLGLALGLALLHWVIDPLLGSFFAGLFIVPASAIYLAPVIAAGIVLVSMLIPVWEIFRLRAARLAAP